MTQASTHLFELLELNELALAGLYTVLSEKFPDTTEFWRQAALEEKAHADVIAQLKRQYDAGGLGVRASSLRSADIQSNIDRLTRARTAASTTGLSEVQALRSAVRAESAMIEGGFFDLFEAIDVPMERELKLLLEHTKAHQAKFTAQLACSELAARRRAALLSLESLGRTLKSICEMYGAFAGAIAGTGGFWGELEEVRREQVEALAGLSARVAEGASFVEFSGFDPNEMGKGLEIIEWETKNAAVEGISARRSLDVAIEVAARVHDIKLIPSEDESVPQEMNAQWRRVVECEERVRQMTHNQIVG